MINGHFVTHFIKHYWSATRIDVLHSPFIFNLYNTCIARQPKPEELKPVEDLREQAFHDHTLLTQHDLGAGGRKNNARKKPVSFFAKVHAKPKRIAHIIYRMVKKYGYENCMELGTSLGFTSMCIAKALPKNGHLKTIEGAPELAAVAQKHFNALSLQNKIELLTGNFDEVLPEMIKKHGTIDFAFIDGNHTYESTMDYFKQLLFKVNNNSVLIFDDIYWSKGMTRAWEEIKQHPEVSVTVDLFFIGLVYFRTEQVKEHFVLRVL
ncbi:MAG: class I SAM-dependent methyltransferase [Bacteroidota bacterium]